MIESQVVSTPREREYVWLFRVVVRLRGVAVARAHVASAKATRLVRTFGSKAALICWFAQHILILQKQLFHVPCAS